MRHIDSHTYRHTDRQTDRNTPLRYRGEVMKLKPGIGTFYAI